MAGSSHDPGDRPDVEDHRAVSAPSPPLRPHARGPVPVQTADEAAAFDRRAIDAVGVPEPVLMENAGRSAALVARAVFFGGVSAAGGGSGRTSASRRPSVVALVGSGNNGGDALVALRSFAAWDHPVRAVLVADRAPDDPLLHGWSVDVVTDEDLDDDELGRILGDADLVVDGILGTGVRGAPRERQARVIRVLNGIAEGPHGPGDHASLADGPSSAGPAVLALDVPSGVDASTGAVPGEVVRADLTVSFGAPKLGALLHPARARVGRHVTVEIGFPPMLDDDASAFLVTPEWVARRLPRRPTDTHKNRVGRVVVVGGGAGMAGAAVLTGQAAFRSGAGLVQIASVAENREAIHGALPEAIFVDVTDAAALDAALDEADAVAAGPGLGTHEAASEVLRTVIGGGPSGPGGTAPLVLDADALNLAAEGAVDLAGVAADRPVLITPHPGEMTRLMDGGAGEDSKGDSEGRDAGERDAGGPDERTGPEASAAEIARRAVERFGCAVLFKGAPSLVASPEGSLAVDSQSSSDLAVAGMGDTLTGVCAGLLAQDRGSDTARAGSLALYLTGRAATLASRGPGLTPSDVAERLPDAVNELLRGARSETDLALPFVILDADPAR